MMRRVKGKLNCGEEVGTLVGHGNKPAHLQMVVAFSEREKAPKLGEFIVVEEREFLKRKILCRVEEIGYGDFQTTRGERERALVEKYIRKSAGYDRELTEEEKKTLFFLGYTLRVLGEIREKSRGGKTYDVIATDYRMLPELTAICRMPHEEEFKVIVSAGLSSGQAEALPTIGHLTYGSYEVEEISIPFEPDKFDAKRTAVFARTGYGKSNLTKTVVALAGMMSNSGMLVLDLDGEYAFSTANPDGTPKYGLADLDLLKPKLVVYTERQDVDKQYKGIDVRRMVNLAKLDSRVIAGLMQEQDLKVVQNFRNLDYDENAREKWNELVGLFLVDQEQEDKKAIRDKIDEFHKAFETEPKQRNALEREIWRLKDLHNPRAGDLVEEIRRDTGRGKLVVLDLSLFALAQGIRIADTVLYRLFNYNLWGITQDKAKPVIAVFEEAQNVLDKKAVDAGTSIFVRWAKEGRKFKLGLIYVTQQPGAIAEEIVSQTDNFFVMHLLNKGDIDSLTHANRHYDGVTARFLGDETVVGNAYVYSAPRQPYVFPARLLEFTPKVFDNTLGKFTLEEFANHLKSSHFSPNRQDVNKAVGGLSRVIYSWLMSQQSATKPSWLDNENRWVDFGYAKSLLRILDQTGLFPVPELRDALKTGFEEELT
jgi:DNA helicase HerA-like ATPase